MVADRLSGVPHIQVYRRSADQYRPTGRSLRLFLPRSPSGRFPEHDLKPVEQRAPQRGAWTTDWPTAYRHGVAVNVSGERSGRPVRGSPLCGCPPIPRPHRIQSVGRDDVKACACCCCGPSGAVARLRGSPALSRIESTPTTAGRAARAHSGARSRQGTTLYRVCLTYGRAGCPATTGGPETANASRLAMVGCDGCVVGLPVRRPTGVGSLTRSRIEGDAKRAVDPGWRPSSVAHR